MTLKTLKFHKMYLYTFKNNSEINDDDNPKKIKTLKEANKVIYDIVKKIKSEKGIFSYKSGKSNDTIEFINAENFLSDDSNTILFGKISKIKDYHNYQKRKRSSKEEINIIQSNDELFESRTFFILDTSNLVISYISEQGSPSIKSIEHFFTSITKQSNTFMTIRCEILDIMSLETINSISNNEYIGDITYKMEIPNEFSERDIPLKLGKYEKLHNQSAFEISIKQKTKKRGTSIFNNSDTTDDKKKFFNKIKEIPYLKQITAKTKEKKTDKVRNVVVDDKNPFIMKINFDFENNNDNNYNENICKRILTEYNNVKDKITKIVR